MGLPTFRSLRHTLLLLVLLTALPALALILSTAWEQRRQAVMGAQEDALRLARLAAADHARLIEGARSLLIGLAQLSDVQMHNAKACTALFAKVQQQFPLYTNIGAIRPDGEVFCAARARASSEKVVDAAFVKRALAAREFTVSGYRPDAVTGKPMMVLSYPAIDRGGSTWAVVFAELDLDWMALLADKAQLPRGTEITVTDSAGLVLARYPDYANWAGKSAGDWPVLQALRRASGEGTLQAGPGLEGRERIFGFTTLADPKHEGPVFVSVGIPRDAALADADRLLIRNLLWAGLVLVLMLVAAAIVSDLLILRRLASVVRAAGRLTAGDLAARATVHGSDEIGVMARAFNIMAARLQVRVRDEETIKQGLAARVNELDLLNRMGELFQACLSLEEAYAVIGRLAPRLFPTEAGAVLALNPARTLMEVVATWGTRPIDGAVFPAEACWALRNSRPHVVEAARASVLCEHLPSPPPAAYVCTPLVAQGNSLGILYVSSEAQGDKEVVLTEAKQRLADTVAAQVGLGLSNVQLREILRIQSIHDPLTGLFNRRYMAETLEREVHRARRGGDCLGLLMLDIDGFKQQNDAFGHDAGDAILVELAALLQRNLRKEDIACRYGGEEFVLVLPDASMENSGRRAEQLRDAVRRMRVPHKDIILGPVTVSIGVAAFPEHGTDGAGLLKAADMALYEAKKAGRDRVMLAASPEPWQA